MPPERDDMLREFLEEWRESQRKGVTLQRVFDEVTATRTELGAHAKQDETRYLETQIALTKLGKNGHGNGDRKSGGGLLTKALESEAGKIVSKAIPLVIAALLGWLSHHLALVNPTPPADAAEQHAEPRVGK